MSELTFEDVTVRFGRGHHAMTAVDDVSLTVPSGKVVGLVGESGSGKSTLARAAVGLAPLSAGRILIDGSEVKTGGRKRPPLQMIFQDPFASLDPRMGIGESIAEAMPGRPGKAERRAEAARLLELVNLDPERATMLPSGLSGGQRQRVALARALAARPDVIIADEITSALDVSVQGAVLNLVRDLQQQLDLGLLFITHNLAVVNYVSDFVAVMYLGQIVEYGPTGQVLGDPRHPYTQALLESVPRRGRELVPVLAGDTASITESDTPDPRNPPPGCRFHTRCPIGPLVFGGRAICRTTQPQVTASESHLTACHFAGDRTGLPVAAER